MGLESSFGADWEVDGEWFVNDGRGSGFRKVDELDDDEENRLWSCLVGEIRVLMSSTDISFVGEC